MGHISKQAGTGHQEQKSVPAATVLAMVSKKKEKKINDGFRNEGVKCVAKEEPCLPGRSRGGLCVRQMKRTLFPAPVADTIMFSLVEIIMFSSPWCKLDDFIAQKD